MGGGATPQTVQLHRIPEQQQFFQLLTQTLTKMAFICSKAAAGRYYCSLKTDRELDKAQAKRHI